MSGETPEVRSDKRIPVQPYLCINQHQFSERKNVLKGLSAQKVAAAAAFADIYWPIEAKQEYFTHEMRVWTSLAWSPRLLAYWMKHEWGGIWVPPHTFFTCQSAEP